MENDKRKLNELKIQEMQQQKRFGDSLHQEQIAIDSAFQELMDESSRKFNQSIADAKLKQVEETTNEVMQQQEKEKMAKRKTILLALSAFLITIIVAGIISIRKKQKNRSAQ
jgi:uncharacterized membrane protein YvbJ